MIVKTLGCVTAIAAGCIAVAYVVAIFTLIKLIREDIKKYWK